MPVIIGGQKMGLIGTEIDIASVNTAILHHTIRQFSFIGLILMGALLLMMVFINQHFIRRIIELEAKVMEFSKTKDSNVAGEIRGNIRGRDEVSSLSEEVAQMIEEIRNYVNNIVMIHQELDAAHTNVARMSELALKDGLTGIRNRTAYRQETQKLEATLSDDGTEFAIAMIDMNDLKKFNDVYGHEQGNAAIIKLSRIACDTFKHSMVFRIGGDEFVVILLHKDYANRERLVQELQGALDTLQRDETLEPWEKPNAAIGLATYDPEKDTTVEDVFRRADERMYQRKKQMKPKGTCR
ncbi:MAG: GGDEF domain-containing protein [Oscillibacter sp.]|nr:GGDEF domain-containing protein [Oscillibacter sp.]